MKGVILFAAAAFLSITQAHGSTELVMSGGVTIEARKDNTSVKVTSGKGLTEPTSGVAANSKAIWVRESKDGTEVWAFMTQLHRLASLSEGVMGSLER